MGRPRVIRKAAYAGVALILLGVVLMSGAVPINASSGHWRVTAFVLDLVKRRSVDTHSFFITAPPLNDPVLITKGAGHYESGCASCHGSPAAPRPHVVMGMTPHPPFLPERIRRWLPRELFYIVKHGLKFTAMPAWPSHSRDDEIWAMVAFLRTLPALDAEGYRALAFGAHTNPADSLLAGARGEEPDATIERCGRCHGANGQGRGLAAFPRLAAQKREYLVEALQAYAKRERHSGMMIPVATSLDRAAIQHVASYYAAQTPAVPQNGLDPAAISRGETIAAGGIPAQEVPGCRACHDDAGEARNPAYPRLAGQYAEYLSLQLQLFAEGRRGGSPYAAIMQPIAARLTPQQRHDVAAYWASRE